MMKGGRTLEINPRHPLIIALNDKVAEDDKSPEALAIAKVSADALFISFQLTVGCCTLAPIAQVGAAA